MNTSQSTILVTGAAGRLGSAVINNIVAHAGEGRVMALVRNEQRAQHLFTNAVGVVEGDYMQPTSLTDTFRSVNTLVLISSPDTEHMAEHHANVIAAAQQAEVRHIIYTSVLHLPDEPHFEASRHHQITEKLLVRSKIPHTIMRNGFYLDVIPQLIGDFTKTNTITYPAGDGMLTSASIADIATAIAKIAQEPEKHANKIYEISATTGFTFTDIATVLSNITKKDILYRPSSLADMKAGLQSQKLPASLARMILSGAEAIAANELYYPSADLQTILGREPMKMDEYLKSLFLRESI